jgi:chloride channel protein, CIC family
MTEPAARPSGREYLRLIAIGAAIGIPAALIAALFLALVHELQGWLWDDLPDALDYSSPPWFLVVGLPVVGALIVVVARRFLPGDGGHPPIEGLSSAPTPVRNAMGVALAALGTLGFGAVLGPEMPVIALGSAVGMVVIAFVKLDQRGTAVISTAGSFSAVSAIFGGPITAGVLLTEAGVGMGAALIPALLPGFVAAAVGYLVFVGFGDWGGLNAPGLTIPDLPLYEGTHVGDLAVAIAVGIVVAMIINLVHRLGRRVDGLRVPLGMPVLLLAGGLAVGLCAQLADWLGADSQDVLFSGQSSVPVVLAEDSTKIIVVLLIAKFLAYVVSLGCGFRGGPIFPAIFLGVALASLAVVWFDTSPTLALVVGTAAGMAAQTRLIVSGLVFAALEAGLAGVDAIPAAVLAAAAAWLTATFLESKEAADPGRPASQQAQDGHREDQP